MADSLDHTCKLITTMPMALFTIMHKHEHCELIPSKFSAAISMLIADRLCSSLKVYNKVEGLS